jgi:hypothetical protein
MWPAALYISFFWPLCFPIAVFTKNYLIQNEHGVHPLAGLWISGSVWVRMIVASAFLLFVNKVE